MSAARFIFRAAIAGVLALAMIAAGCRGREQSDDEDVSAPAQSAAVMLVSAERAAVAPMRREIRVLGVTVANRHVAIRSPAAGRVVGINLRNGDIVHKGQVIAHVINREIEAAQAGLEIARKLNPEDAKSLAQSVERYSRDAGIPVIAPDSGVVAKPPVTSGQLVSDLDTIVDLIDPASIYVQASVPLGDLHLMQPGMSATITSPLRPGANFPARVAAMIPAFDPASATAPVRIDFTGTQRILETDAPVEARVEVESVPDAIVVPNSALFQDSGAVRYHLFVAGADGRAHRVEVAVGIRAGDRVQITSGIKPGDEVITSGGYALSDGLRIKIAGNQP